MPSRLGKLNNTLVLRMELGRGLNCDALVLRIELSAGLNGGALVLRIGSAPGLVDERVPRGVAESGS